MNMEALVLAERTDLTKIQLQKKDRNAEGRFEQYTVNDLVGGSEARSKLGQDAAGLGWTGLEFYSRAALVSSGLSNKEYEETAQKLATGMRRVAWEKLGRLARRKKNEQAFMAGGYDQEIIERWNVLNAPFSGKKSLIDAAEPGYGEFTEKITRYKIKAFNGRGELVPAEPVPNFDALCRIVSLQKFEAASVGSGKTLIVGQTTFNRQEIKILEEIGESRRQGKTATVYKGMSAGQEFLIKNAAQCIYHDAGNSNKPTASKKEFIDLYLKGGSKLSASDRSKLSLESSQSVWDWAKETWDLEKEGLPPPQAEPEAKAEPAAEEEEPFHLISEEELRQKGDDHGERQPVSDLLPEDMPPVPEEKSETPDWFRKLQAAAVAPAVEEPEAAAAPPFSEEPDEEAQVPAEKKPEPPLGKVKSPDLQALIEDQEIAQSTLNLIKDLSSTTDLPETREKDSERVHEANATISRVKQVFNEEFGVLSERGLFRRAFGSIGGDEKLDVFNHQLVELGIKGCKAGRLDDETKRLLDDLYWEVNGILLQNHARPLMNIKEFLSAFNKLTGRSVVPEEPEETEESKEKPASTEAEKSKKIALTDFRL